ncbi:hypothetical protein SAMN04487894_1103 [Niabella drilacis]|uniref:Uncharacterized protein n=1 Tax=Niabella drilacis (strain DSM 25811 / CCM 8410 / CCUG 62505 / LMG 26954 / E90) TaxID=1285928 RepID=A0A1G6VFN5_NIADE|nr:hypothetical protein SAMN04487894_1103 [Niabella drilacis]
MQALLSGFGGRSLYNARTGESEMQAPAGGDTLHEGVVSTAGKLPPEQRARRLFLKTALVYSADQLQMTGTCRLMKYALHRFYPPSSVF